MDLGKLADIGFLSKFKPIERISRVGETEFFNASNELSNRKDWFFTAEAKAKYDALETVFDKTWFIYNFLYCITPDRENDREKRLFKMAYVFASAIDGTSLPYATYPDIIDERKNALISAQLYRKSMYSDLDELFEKMDIGFASGGYASIKKAKDDNYTEKYKLQRMIMWLLADAEHVEKDIYDMDRFSHRNQIEIKLRKEAGLNCDEYEDDDDYPVDTGDDDDNDFDDDDDDDFDVDDDDDEDDEEV